MRGPDNVRSLSERSLPAHICGDHTETRFSTRVAVTPELRSRRTASLLAATVGTCALLKADQQLL